MMIRILPYAVFTSGLLLLCGPLHAAATQNPADEPGPRQVINFNRDWRFQLGDHPGAEVPNYDDSPWQRIGLPHSFSIPYFLSPDFYVGYGWYRKHFNLPARDRNRQLFLQFEAAFQDAEVFVNGKKVGSHQGGYTGFSIDVTGAMKPGDNVIAVRLNNLWNPRLAPRAGEHTFSGGIYREVYLVVTDPLHVTWYGAAVTTPQVSRESGTVRVSTEIENSSPRARSCTVRQSIVDPAGKVVTTMESTQPVAPGATVMFDQTSEAIPNPLLWDPDHPNLYTVRTTVLDHGKPVDQVSSPLGFRWIQWTAEQGFFLNGEHLYLRGADVHQDHAGWGDAVTNAGIDRDVKMIKDAGFNFIRGSHYPHDPEFAAACDRLGILLWSENAFWGTGGPERDGYWTASAYPPLADDQPGFEASVKQQLREMIRIFRNHPCVIAWSMCNEVFFSQGSVIPKVKSFLGELVAYTRELDPTRPAGIGGAQRPLDQNRIDKVGDIAGYNGDGASIPIFQDPGIPNLVTEYGSTTAVRPGKYDPGWGDLTRDHGEPVHTWRSGQALWCGFDHGSLFGPALGKMGIIDYFRIPKRAWYWYRNAYAGVPPPAWPEPGTPARVQLDADRNSGIRTDGTDDVKLTVTILDAAGKPISNSPPVELSVISGPGEFPTGPSIQFDEQSDIPILDGQAAVEFRSYYAGPTVIRATSPGLTPAEVTINFVGPIPYIAGQTPPTPPRPYVRFSRKDQASVPQEFGRDNPTFASSAAPGHAAGLAADGDPATYWQPAATDDNPSWTLDMERSVNISLVRIRFPAAGVYHYRVEVSDDRVNWRPLADLSQNQQTDASHSITADAGANGRFLRLTFASPPSAGLEGLAEVQVTGTIRER